MKQLKYYIGLIIIASTLSLSAMEEPYPAFFTVIDKKIHKDIEFLNNPEKKPVFRIYLNNNLEKNILQHILNTKTINYLESALTDPLFEEPKQFIDRKFSVIALPSNGQDVIIRTSGNISLEIKLKKNERSNDPTIQHIFNTIDYLNNSSTIKHSWSEENLQVTISILCEQYQYMPPISNSVAP